MKKDASLEILSNRKKVSRLKAEMEEGHIGLAELGEETQIHRSTIHRLLSGKVKSHPGTFARLWMGMQSLKRKRSGLMQEDLIEYGRVTPVFLWEQLERARTRKQLLAIAAGKNIVTKGGNLGVRVEGDSMEPKIYAGETAWMSPSLTARNGDLVFAHIKNRGVVLRLFHGENGQVRLSSYNPLHPPEFFGLKEFYWIFVVLETVHAWR